MSKIKSRRSNLLVILLLAISMVFAVSFTFSHHPDEVRQQPKGDYYKTYGLAWLHDNIYMDKAEVRNIDYLEFLFWLGKKDTALYRKMLPDTAVWRHKIAFQEPYVEYYFRHPAYRYYPMVGVSYEQAVEFCKWRSQVVNMCIYIRDHRLEKKVNYDTLHPEYYPQVMTFRLPTKDEWEYAAQAGLGPAQFPFGYESLKWKKGIPISNLNDTIRQALHNNIGSTLQYYQHNCDGVCAGQLNDASEITVPVSDGKPNHYGIYNLLGNVSEIISDTLVKGYNYMVMMDGYSKCCDSLFMQIPSCNNETAYYYKTYRYPGPQSWLGFRCVCEVKK